MGQDGFYGGTSRGNKYALHFFNELGTIREILNFN
jgi:hypothetical protein